MSTIPASYDVQVLPGVISAGGAALNLNGLMLTQNSRIPINTVQSFPNAATVGSYFGLSSTQYAKAQVYFAGYTGATATPAALLAAQYPQTAVSAWLRGGSGFGSLSIANIQGLSGSLYVTIDGFLHSAATLNLLAATSYSAAAGLIQTALNTTEPVEATVSTTNWSIAPGTAAIFAGTIDNDVLTVTGTTSGTIEIGGVITGSGITAGTQIVAQLTSTANGGALGDVGTYAVSIAHAIATSITITESWGLLTVSTAVATGTLSPGQTLTGTSVTAGSQIMAQLTGTSGGIGTYVVNLTQTASGTGTLTASATNCTVAYDSVSGGIIITSGITGSASTIAAATGTLSGSLFLTTATGAVLSQGSAALSPGVFMAGLTAITQNWASFFFDFDPDDGVAGGAQKLLFSAWVNTTNDRYLYVARDSDIAPTLSSSAPASFGYLLTQANYNGTELIYSPTDLNHDVFVSGMIASVNYSAPNGNITHKFKTQSGLVAGVTNSGTAANLTANGYNFVGAYATANANFVYFAEGGVSGVFQWANTYANQIWLNNSLQLALVNLLTSIGSIPYNYTGYAMIEAACLTTIQQALLFGAIQPGVTLSSTQILEITTEAGGLTTPAQVISQRGWYFLVVPATPQVRQARTSPVIYFWYADGGSVHKLTLNSLDVE